MKKLKLLLRLLYINHVLMRHGLGEIILATGPLAPLRFLRWFNPYNWWRSKHRSQGERIRCALEALGPIFVKFGQILSTRRDLLPDDIAEELAKLQDKVPPFSSTQAIDVIEKSLKRSVRQLFESFDPKPLASASIAQVHAAVLPGGKSVVVKVLRPHIKKAISRDLDLLYFMAGLAERYWSEGPRLHPKAVVKEFEHTLMDELDLMREAGNASQLRRNFTGSNDLYVPEVYWDYAHSRVLVMERIYGTPIADMDALRAQNTNLKKLSERGVEIFFTQVFRDRFFHADMHPGNIFVDVQNPNDPRYEAVDFGIVGTLNVSDQRYLAENFLAFFRRDYRRVAELHVASGWVGQGTRVDEFEAAIRTVCEPIFERPLKEISFGQTLIRLFQTARRFNMEVQPQLVLLQKTLLNIEGLGRQLYPELDLWTTAKPFLEKWLRNQMGPRAFFRKIKSTLPDFLEKAPEFPGLLYETIQSVKENTKVTQRLPQPIIPRKSSKKYLWVGGSLAFFSASMLLWFPHIATILKLAYINSYSGLFAALGAATGVAFLIQRHKEK